MLAFGAFAPAPGSDPATVDVARVAGRSGERAKRDLVNASDTAVGRSWPMPSSPRG